MRLDHLLSKDSDELRFTILGRSFGYVLHCLVLRVTSIIKWGRSSAGRAPALQAGGQEFDSPRLHHLFLIGIQPDEN